jgi:hypothetical protein
MTSSVDEPISPPEWWRLSSAELRAAIEDAESGLRSAYAQYLQILREVDARGVGVTFGYASVGALVCGVSARSRGQANRMAKQAVAVASFPVAGAAVLSGSISVEHLDVITEFRKSLSERVHPAAWDEAEATLVDLATAIDPSALRQFINAEVRPRLDPDGVLPEEKDLAEPRNSLSLNTRANGWVEFHGLLEPCSGGLFGSQISAMSAPTAPPEGGPDPRTLDERQGDAMAHWVDLGRDGVPTEGGERPQLVVTIGLDELISGLGYGAMGPDQLPFSVSEARRLACDCSIVPIVLSADSVPLDVGRASRTIPVNIRRAVLNRDKGCAFPGCDKPGSWCQVHHIVEWQHGGPTKPENLALLCGQHHRLIHHSEWEVRMANGYPEFIPPGWLDGPRTPRTNPVHSAR